MATSGVMSAEAAGEATLVEPVVDAVVAEEERAGASGKEGRRLIAAELLVRDEPLGQGLRIGRIGGVLLREFPGELLHALLALQAAGDKQLPEIRNRHAHGVKAS